MVMETGDLILGKAKYEDWEAMYRNVWSKPETAEYMAWTVTADGQAVGFAGVEKLQSNTWQDTGIARGPEFVGRGYGKQILELLMEYCISLGGTEFYYSARLGNSAAKVLALSCGFVFQYAERKTDLGSGEPYKLEIYRKDLKDIGSV